jgi:nitroreductase
MSTDFETPAVLEGVGDPPADPRPDGSSIFDDGIPTRGELTAIDWLLTTTRSNRKTLDLTREVPLEVIAECIEIAQQGPAAHNEHNLHWLVITDEKKRAAIADVYARSWNQLTGGAKKKPRQWKGASRDADRVQDSANWLPEHLHEVPVFVIPVMTGPRYNDDRIVSRWIERMHEGARQAGIEGEPSRLWMDGGYFASAYPSIWSFQLALRSRGLGSVLTVVHLAAEQLVAKELGLNEREVQTCLIPVAYTTKRNFKTAKRPPLESRLHIDSWRGRELP